MLAHVLELETPGFVLSIDRQVWRIVDLRTRLLLAAPERSLEHLVGLGNFLDVSSRLLAACEPRHARLLQILDPFDLIHDFLLFVLIPAGCLPLRFDARPYADIRTFMF